MPSPSMLALNCRCVMLKSRTTLQAEGESPRRSECVHSIPDEKIGHTLQQRGIGHLKANVHKNLIMRQFSSFMDPGVNVYRRGDWSTRISSLCNEHFGTEPFFSICICSQTGDYLYILSRRRLTVIDLVAARIKPSLPSDKVVRQFHLSMELEGTKIHKAFLEERFRLFIAVLSTDGLFVIHLPITQQRAISACGNGVMVIKIPIFRSVISDVAWDIQSKTASLLFILCKDSYLR